MQDMPYVPSAQLAEDEQIVLEYDDTVGMESGYPHANSQRIVCWFVRSFAFTFWSESQ